MQNDGQNKVLSYLGANFHGSVRLIYNQTDEAIEQLIMKNLVLTENGPQGYCNYKMFEMKQESFVRKQKINRN